MNLSTLSFVDIETTGASIYRDRVIEIGILRVENGKLVKTYQTLINPETYLPPFIEGMTGITSIELEKAPTFSQIKDEVQDILKDALFVAHNVRFDYGFLKNEFKRHGISFSSKHFCTVKLSRHFYPRRIHHNLDSIIEKFAIECQARHRAFGDAEVLWQFYQILEKTHGAEKLAQAIKSISRRPSLPGHLASTLPNALPSSPGVYIFYGKSGIASAGKPKIASERSEYGKEDIPLYIGKSINIKQRVLSHFSNDHTSSQEMKICQNTHRIEVIPTAGELSALLKEASLIKKIQPLYNKKLRATKELLVAKKGEWENYSTVTLERVSTLSAENAECILAVFRNKHHAKDFLHFLSKEHNLCHKLLGLDNTSKACFASQLGWCKGACTKKETALRYNMRFAQAFASSRIKPWPFPGPIAIEETHPTGEKTARFIIDKWCLLDSKEAIFDLDTYKILYRYLKNPNNIKKVKNIPSHQPLFSSVL